MQQHGYALFKEKCYRRPHYYIIIIIRDKNILVQIKLTPNFTKKKYFTKKKLTPNL